MRYLLLILIICYGMPATAGVIKGTVLNAQNVPVPAVNILLLSAADSSIVTTAVTDEEGKYAIEVSASGTYHIKAAIPGYSVAYSAPVAYESGDVSVATLVLSANQKKLSEVTVRAEKPLIEVHADKIVVNVENSITATGSTVLEVLQRAPGVTVDNNENISLKGRQGVNVMLDGKLIPVSGGDLANLLKGMPSGSIEKIEIISNPGARYDAAGRAGIINIRTKKDKRMGANGNLTGGYSQGVYPKANGGIGLNYRDKKLVVYSNLNLSYREGVNDLTLYRQFFDSGRLTSVYNQTNVMRIPTRSQFLTVGGDYSISRNTTIGAVFTGGLSRFDIMGESQATRTGGNGEPMPGFVTWREAENHGDNLGVNLNLRHQLDTSGSDLSIDLDYARYNNSSDQTLNTSYVGPAAPPNYVLYGIMSGYTDIRSAKADYIKPFKNGLRLDAGVKASMVHADNDPAFYDRSSGVSIFDTGKSNHFIYDENINAVYLNAAQDWKQWSMQLGLRGEQTIAKGHQLINNERFDRNYAQLFPSVALIRHLNAKHDLGITLSRRIDRPAYQQLNPFRRYLDQTSVSQGNPYLKPALTWAAELTHTWDGKFITQFAYNYTSDAIINVIQPEAGQITIVTDKNLATNSSYIFSGTYPSKPWKWWNSVNSLNVFYNHFSGDLANTPLNAGRTTLQVSTQNTFTLPKSWTSELTFFYQSPQRYGYMQLKPNYVLSAGVQKSFHEGITTLKLSFTDILRRQNPRGSSEFESYYEDFEVVRDSRVATLQATYRFGKRTVAPVRRRQRGAEDELKRAASGAS
jgi:hypothetical protein